jgi:predicted ATP-grasp superfamily ATP-dependent carboligase
VLIVDEGRERSSVAVARALASCGWTVGAASPEPNIASRSRATSQWHRVEHTSSGDDRFFESVEKIVSEGGYEAVFATWEAAVESLSSRRERLPVPVGYGPHQGLLQAMDKEQLTAIALRCGLGAPRTVAATPDAIDAIQGPVVIKPASPVDAQFAAQAYAHAGEAQARIAAIAAAGGRAIAQEKLSGPLIAVSLVARDAEIVSVAQQLAVHAWPHPVGVTARGVTVAVDETLLASISLLLGELRWSGLAQLQFLVPDDGVPRLLDFNPRFYGSIALAISSGANHPDTWARMSTGRDVAPSRGRAGATFQWFTRDLRASLAAPERSIELGRFAYTAATAAHSLWSPSEPLLAPRFLLEQGERAAASKVPLLAPLLSTVRSLAHRGSSDAQSHRRGGGGGRGSRLAGGAGAVELRDCALHGLPSTDAVRRALRKRRVPSTPERDAQRIAMKLGALSFERSWLNPLVAARREALEGSAENRLRVLVRVDEFPYYSGHDEPRFGYEASQRFHAVMAEECVPHLMSVLPQWTHDALDPAGSGGRPLDDRDVELLGRMRADGVTFAQHGNTHRTRHSDPRRHSELCGLDAGSLEQLLAEGREKLAAVGVQPRVFVPPFNRFDAAQWPVLERDYDVITGGPESIRLMGFHGGPLWRGSAVYLPCYAPLYEHAAAILPHLQSLIDSGVTGWLPVVLHMGWEVEDDFAALRRLAKVLAPVAVPWEELLAAVDSSAQA